MTSDKSNLAGQRTLLEDPANHVILAEELNREPLGPVVRQTDGNWFDIVSWVIQCTLNAEYLAVDRTNVDQLLESDDVAIQRLLGVTGDLGQMLGLPDDFCYQVVAQVGQLCRHLQSSFWPRHTASAAARPERALYQWRPTLPDPVPMSLA